jgi:hypothetical protein
VQQISLTSFGLRLPTRQLRQQNKKPATAKAGRAKLATGGARGDVVVAGLRGEPRGFHVIKIAGRPKENNSTNGCGSPPRRYRAPIRLDRQGWGLRSCGPLGLCHIVRAEAACRSMAQPYRVYTYSCLLHFDPYEIGFSPPTSAGFFWIERMGARTPPPAAAVIHGSRHRPATLRLRHSSRNDAHRPYLGLFTLDAVC